MKYTPEKVEPATCSFESEQEAAQFFLDYCGGQYEDVGADDFVAIWYPDGLKRSPYNIWQWKFTCLKEVQRLVNTMVTEEQLVGSMCAGI